MQLTESQLFTIEALNRIEGFVWPDGVWLASMPLGSLTVHFYCDLRFPPMSHFRVGVKHPNCIDSLITKAEFDSMDGWVRNTKLRLPPEILDSRVEVLHHNGEIAFDEADAFYWDENVDKWRYRKPLNTDLPPTQDVPPVGAPVAPPSPTDLVDVALRKYVETQTHTHVLQSTLDEAKQQESAALEALNNTMKALNLSVVVDTPEQVTQDETEGESDWPDYTWKTEVSYEDNRERLHDFATSIIPNYWASDVQVLEVYPAYLILLDGKKNKVKVTTRLGKTAFHNVAMFVKVE